jgi:hypothetical protein
VNWNGMRAQASEIMRERFTAEEEGRSGEDASLPLEIDREPESFLGLVSKMWNSRMPSLAPKDRKALNNSNSNGAKVPESKVRLASFQMSLSSPPGSISANVCP